MRGELEVRRELKAIEALVEKPFANGDLHNVAYGAYRALNWMLGERTSTSSASHALEMMEAWAAEREGQDAV